MAKPLNKAKPRKKIVKQKPFYQTHKKWLVFIVAAVLIFWLLWSNLFKLYPMKGNKEILVVANGDTYSRFIERLDKDHVIAVPLVLKIYQKLFIRDTMKAGVYEINKNMSIRQILVMLSNAENAQMNRILVIEGTTFKQLMNNLKNDPKVVHTLTDASYAQVAQQLGITHNNPEGLFAPNTYFFSKGETDKKILTELYQAQMKILDSAWQRRAPNLPYKNKYDALIMASIIEKETSLDRELNQVSGVFVRRLQQGMRLQTDPTVIYGMGDKYQGKITREDLRTATAYNTYTISGLPPTPIALPSKKSIEAAMHPDQSRNLYFVATGNGGHKFSATLEEHNQAVQNYLAVLKSKN